MSTCSAAEIAEKKRIALEKLQAKKAQLQTGTESNSNSNNNNNNNNNTANTAPKVPAVSKSVFYGSANTTAPSLSTPASRPATAAPTTSARDFLNALKQCSALSNRIKAARESTHPYQRPTEAKRSSGPQSHPLSPKSTLRLSPPKQLAPVFNKGAATCKVYLVSQLRFAVESSGFNQQLIDVFKKVPSKNYDNNTRIWSFAVKDYQLLQQLVQPLKPTVVFGAIPKSVLNLCTMPAKPLDTACLASIEATLAEKLLPFQQEGVCFSISQHGRVMICDEMGLGKTYQALAVADFYREDWPLLICTTASTRESWANHVRELLPSIPLHYIQVFTTNHQYFGDAKVLITSYNMMERHFAQLNEHRFRFLIFDESHMLKNAKAKCTSVADRLAVQAKHIVLLTGTPALSRPVELFTQLQLIDRKFMGFMEYSSRYCDGKQSHFGWDASGQSNLDELNVMLRLKFMIRRTKADVLPEMAEKFRETVVLDPALVWPNEQTMESLSQVAKQFSSSRGREKEELLLKFYARTAEVKTRAVCAYLKGLIKEHIKFIVFAHHRVMLDAITEFLVKTNVNFIRIDGSTKNESRAEYIDRFQKKSKCQVAVLSLKACNSGITLTAAEMIIFAELDWNPSTLAQAESRAHRIGQHKAVTCRYLMATKTADDIIWNMLKAKQDVLNRAGIFCDNLQAATHTTAPTMSHKIEQYFSPEKDKRMPSAAPTANNTSMTTAATDKHLDLHKECENIDELFNDGDDEAFKDLVF